MKQTNKTNKQTNKKKITSEMETAIRKLNICMPAFMQIDMQSKHGPVWILGMPFFRYYHTTFDRAAKNMRFAIAAPACEPQPLRQNKTKSLLTMQSPLPAAKNNQKWETCQNWLKWDFSKMIPKHVFKFGWKVLRPSHVIVNSKITSLERSNFSYVSTMVVKTRYTRNICSGISSNIFF